MVEDASGWFEDGLRMAEDSRGRQRMSNPFKTLSAHAIAHEYSCGRPVRKWLIEIVRDVVG